MPSHRLELHASAGIDAAQIASIYDRLAPFYDSFGRQPVRDAYLSLFSEDLAGHRVLDAGCGAGQDSVALSTRGAAVTGVDISPGMLDRARHRLAGRHDVTLLQVNSEETAFDSGCFDAILSAMEIIHHNSLARVLSEYSRLLSSGGTLVLVTNHPYRNVLLRGDGNWLWEGVVEEDWGHHGRMPKQHWALQSYVNTLASVGFLIRGIHETEAPEDVRTVQDVAINTTARFPSFLIFEAVRTPA